MTRTDEVVTIIDSEIARLSRSLDRAESTVAMTARDHANMAVRIAMIQGGIESLRDVRVALTEEGASA